MKLKREEIEIYTYLHDIVTGLHTKWLRLCSFGEEMKRKKRLIGMWDFSCFQLVVFNLGCTCVERTSFTYATVTLLPSTHFHPSFTASLLKPIQ